MVDRTATRSKTFISDYLERTIATLSHLPLADVERLLGLVQEAKNEGRNLFLCGNGGSAATSSHFATELGKMASVGRSTRFRVYSLTDNTAWITALANDATFDDVFVEQLKNFARPGDLLIAFSGSGNSPNVVNAVHWANENGLITIGLTGNTSNRLAEIAQLPIRIDSDQQGQIEEGHFVIQHLVSYFFIR